MAAFMKTVLAQTKPDAAQFYQNPCSSAEHQPLTRMPPDIWGLPPISLIISKRLLIFNFIIFRF